MIQRSSGEPTPGKRTLTESLPAGRPGMLPPAVQAKMESFFGQDFSSVRVREDARARDLGAVAYTQGDQIVFQPGRYDPTSRAGQELIGHELAHVVQQRQGRAAAPAGGGAEPPVQRYTEHTREGKQIHVSDGQSMFVHAGGGEPNKVFYAKLDALQRAQAALASAGSLIHLEAASINRGFARIEPRFVAEGEQRRGFDVTEDRKQKPITDHGPRMGMAADCNNAARMVMGVLQPPQVTESAPDHDKIERPVLSLGGEERMLDVSREAMGGTKGAHEKAALTALTASLREYRAVVAERPVQRSHPESVTAFLDLTAGLNAPKPVAWTILGTLRASHPALYADLTLWAGLDSAIMPEVGDALVAWRLTGDRTAVNPRGYNAMVDVVKANLEDEQARATMTRELDAKIRAQQTALDELLQKIREDNAILAEEPAPEGDLQALEKRQSLARNRLAYRGKQQPEIERVLSPLRAAMRCLEAFDGDNGAQVARAALAALGIADDTPWSQIMQPSTDTSWFGEDVEGQLSVAMASNELWNKHWGGVVMTEPASGDYVTLENDASTEQEHGPVNAQWRFTMYGSRKPEQSFHDQNEATGDFGPRASTVRFRAPNRRERGLPEPTQAEREEAERREQERRAQLTAEQERLERERVEEEQRREQERLSRMSPEEVQREKLRRRGVPTGLTLRPYSCGTEARRDEGRDGFDGGGGPPALFKAADGAVVNTDPALEAEADAQGAAAARHGEDGA